MKNQKVKTPVPEGTAKTAVKKSKCLSEEESKSYSSVEEMMDSIDTRWKWYDYVYIPLWRVWDYIYYTPKRIKWFCQRGKHGYSDRDVWNLDYHLANIIVNSVKQLKEEGHGLPTWEGNLTEEEALAKWDEILDNIIYTFDIVKKSVDSEIYLYHENPEDRKALYKMIKEINKKYPEDRMRMLSKGEQGRYERGWDNFKEHFLNLWD